MAVAASHPARHLQPRRRLDPACELSRPSAALCPRPHLLPSGRPARWQPGGPRGARGLRPPAGAGGALSAGPALLKVTALEVSPGRSEEHTSELPSLIRISYAVFCF